MPDTFINAETIVRPIMEINGWIIEELNRTWDDIGSVTVSRLRKGHALWALYYYNNDNEMVEVHEFIIRNIFRQNLDIPTEIAFFLWSLL